MSIVSWVVLILNKDKSRPVGYVMINISKQDLTGSGLLYVMDVQFFCIIFFVPVCKIHASLLQIEMVSVSFSYSLCFLDKETANSYELALEIPSSCFRTL